MVARSVLDCHIPIALLFPIQLRLTLRRERNGGHAWLTVNQYEIGVTDRAELLIEPFFYEWIHPKGGAPTSGVGDLEITPS
jgi:hypothetical protein